MSLRTLLAIVFGAVAFAGISAETVAVGKTAAARIRAEIGRDLEQAASATAATLDTMLAERRSDLSVLAAFPALGACTPGAPLGVLQKALDGRRRASTAYPWIAFARLDGAVIAATGGMPLSAVQNAMALGRAVGDRMRFADASGAVLVERPGLAESGQSALGWHVMVLQSGERVGAALLVLLAVLVGWLFASRIASPFAQIAGAAAAVARGDPSAAIVHETSRYIEVSVLARSPADSVERAREQGSLLGAAVDTSSDAVIAIDERGTIELFDAAAAQRICGYTSDEVIGSNVRSLMPEPYRGQHDCYMSRCLRTGERRIIGIGRLVIAQRKDGTTLPCELSVGDARIAGGRRIFTGFIRDVSRQRDTEARLATVQPELLQLSRLSALGQMGSQLAHDLNQPLGAIANCLEASRQLAAESEDPSVGRARRRHRPADARLGLGHRCGPAGREPQRSRRGGAWARDRQRQGPGRPDRDRPGGRPAGRVRRPCAGPAGAVQPHPQSHRGDVRQGAGIPGRPDGDGRRRRGVLRRRSRAWHLARAGRTPALALRGDEAQGPRPLDLPDDRRGAWRDDRRKAVSRRRRRFRLHAACRR